MSRRATPDAAADHPEILAIAHEVTIDPSRRKYYSPLVLTLADIALQNLLNKAVATNNSEPLASRDSSDT